MPDARTTIYRIKDAAVITLFETNSDSVVISNGVEAWSLGPVTPDMAGVFPVDARAWVTGEWEPNEADGQTPATTEGLTAVATFEDGVVSFSVPRDALGAGAATYVGGPAHT